MSDIPLRLGTRASQLARWQARWVARQLRARGVGVRFVPMTTRGDANRTRPVGGLGSEGVFTKTIQRSLLTGTVDLAVHSLKDLPTEPVDGLTLAAVPPRGTVQDALVSRHGGGLRELPAAAVVGTGSPRRQAQLLHARPDLKVAQVRGNVETRLKRLDQGDYDALVLAAAGLERLRLKDRISQLLDPEVLLPAVGQGALAIETRTDDTTTLRWTASLDHQPTRQAVCAERTMMATLQGGCLAPVGAWGRMVDGQLLLTAVVLSLDGKTRLDYQATSHPDHATQLGQRVGRALLDRGADRLIANARAHG